MYVKEEYVRCPFCGAVPEFARPFNDIVKFSCTHCLAQFELPKELIDKTLYFERMEENFSNEVRKSNSYFKDAVELSTKLDNLTMFTILVSTVLVVTLITVISRGLQCQ